MQSRRIDLKREVSIQVPAFDAFITEYSANISANGMFIRSEKPLPPDTELTLEFRIADDWKLIRGNATVVWSRHRNEGPDQPSGMGVLFTELEPQSRRLINWIIEKHVREGGTPFDLGELKQPIDLDDEADPNELAVQAAMGDMPRDEPPTRTAQPSRPPKPKVERPRVAGPPEPVRFRLASLVLAGVVVTLALAGLFWLSERGAQSAANPDLSSEPAADAGSATAIAPPTPSRAPDPSEPGQPDAADPVAVASPARTSTPERPATDPPAASPPAASPPTTSPAPASPPAVSPVFFEATRRLVEGWSRAWSDQDPEAYLSYYSRSFRPADGESRSAWAATRRERLQAPEFIEISVSDLEAEASSDSRGRAIFDQGYRSDTYQDSVRKVLELVREDGRWKILEEKSAD